LNKDRNYAIRVNGKLLAYDHLIEETDQLSWTGYSPDRDTSYHFTINYIRWNQQIGDRYYYYFLNSDKKEIAKVLLPSLIILNNKISSYLQKIIFSRGRPNKLFIGIYMLSYVIYWIESKKNMY